MASLDSALVEIDDLEALTNRFCGDGDKFCRICHGGAEEGRLISPCLCKGSMKFVHLDCLQKWRSLGGERHYFRCDTCHYDYRLQRVYWAQWLTKSWVTHLITLCVMLFMVLLAGYLGRALSIMIADSGVATLKVVDVPSEVHIVKTVVDSRGEEAQFQPEVNDASVVSVSANHASGVASEIGVEAQPLLPSVTGVPIQALFSDQFALEAAGIAASPQPKPNTAGSAHALPPGRTFWDEWTWSCFSLEHWAAGTVVVGLASFVVLFASTPGSFFWGNVGPPTSGRTVRHLELIIFIVVITIGFVKAFVTLQGLVLERTRALMLQAEEKILEVKSEDAIHAKA